LLHYSSKPIAAVRSTVQRAGDNKPRGLWLSVEGEGDWREWCEAESYGDPSKQLCYVTTLAPRAKVLRLATPAAVLRFAKRYACDPFMGPMAGHTMYARLSIDWASVAAKYDGIIIAPYHWTLRHDRRVAWYYSWDCASGCIWNRRAVAALELVVDPSRSTPDALTKATRSR